MFRFFSSLFDVENMNPPPQKKNAHLLTIAVDIDRPEPVSQGDVRGFIFFAQHKPDKVLVAPVFNKRKEVEKKTSERMFFFSSSKGEKKKRLKKKLQKDSLTSSRRPRSQTAWEPAQRSCRRPGRSGSGCRSGGGPLSTAGSRGRHRAPVFFFFKF